MSNRTETRSHWWDENGVEHVHPYNWQNTFSASVWCFENAPGYWEVRVNDVVANCSDWEDN